MRELDLGRNRFGEHDAICLATCVHKIEALRVQWCGIGSRGIEALAQSIREMNHQVKILNNVKLVIFLHDELKCIKIWINAEKCEGASTDARQRDRRQLFIPFCSFILLFSDHAKTFYIHLHYDCLRVVACRVFVNAPFVYKATWNCV